MGVRFPSVQSNVNLSGNPSDALEHVYCTTPPISPAIDGGVVYLAAYLALTIGTAGTAITLRLRRGPTTAGTQINQSAAITVAAGNIFAPSLIYFDTPGIVGGQQYSLTAQITAQTGAANVADVSLIAFVL